ncbi:MAG TPA: hypothetical protein VHC68_02945 [Candidatus Paceibacterota bacterium]|nr:hypothetical protein [Candidatus Paceibacterota bacterium]
MAYLFLALAFLCNGAANVLLKVAAMRGFSFAGVLGGDWNMATFTALAAAGLFALNLCFYLAALEKIPLSLGYPVMIGMTFLITIAASLFLGERIALVQGLGMALIVVGILLAARFAA